MFWYKEQLSHASKGAAELDKASSDEKPRNETIFINVLNLEKEQSWHLHTTVC